MREERRARITQAMGKEGLDWLVLAPSTNLEYLTGVKRRSPAYTRADHHGSWAEIALLDAAGRYHYIAPRMVADFEAVEGEGIELHRLEEGTAIEPQLRRILTSIGWENGVAAVEDAVSAHAVLCLAGSSPRMNLRDGTRLLQEIRRVKTESELAILREAARVTDEAFADVLRQVRVGASEWELAIELEYQMRRRGAEALSFPSVVYGYHGDRPSSIRKYREPRYDPLKEGTILAFDFGCVVDGYCSDFGRTVAIGEPAPEVERFAADLAEAHRLGIHELRSGATANSVHRAVQCALDEAGWGDHFVHRTGHGIGMDVHEDPALDRLDTTRLETSMVFTIEPSVLVEGGLWVRNEDVVVVGEDHGKPLNQSALGLVTV